MNKIKWTILTFAILFSIGSAFATRPRALYSSLYYYTGSGYALAGTEGMNYVCETSSNICTYTYSNGVYTPYQTLSNYTPLGVTTPTTKPAPKNENK
jgi:Family of unknown function (DUF6520)